MRNNVHARIHNHKRLRQHSTTPATTSTTEDSHPLDGSVFDFSDMDEHWDDDFMEHEHDDDHHSHNEVDGEETHSNARTTISPLEEAILDNGILF